MPDIAVAPVYKAAMDLAAETVEMPIEPDRCYRAALSRDPRFDGRFFTGVVTTGVYCRPVCPVAPPKLKNMRFYPCAAAAEAAGFRPCKRCRPETAPGTPAWLGTSAVVSRALRLISEGGLDHDDVDALAERLGLGGRQLRRLFAKHLGASPQDVARARRVHFARRLIDQTDLTFAEVAHASGFRSIRQFNHDLKGTFRQTPSQLRNSRKTTGAAKPAAATTAGSVLVKLPFRPPLAWTAMLDFLRLRAIPGVESVEGGRYRRTIFEDGEAGVLDIGPGPFLVDNEGMPEPSIPASRARRSAAAPHHSPHLLMRVELPHCPNLIAVVERARRIFDLDADPSRIAEHLGGDADLARLLETRPGLRVPGAWDGFELAVRAVLGQQVTVRGATTLAGRLVREFGRPLPLPCGSLTHLFPEAAVLAEADLSRVGLPRARAKALGEVARAAASGRLRFDSALGLEDAVERLASIAGIGPWTAQYIAMRALSEPDAFPDSDLGLRRALGRDGDLASVAAVRKRAADWSPWRSYAAMHLWAGLGEAPTTTTTSAADQDASRRVRHDPPSTVAAVAVATRRSATMERAS